MSDIKAVIVDDEHSARNVLSNLLELQHPEVDIVGVCENLPEAVIRIRKSKPDVVFLDVEMPEFSGYEIVDFFDTIDFQIVFVTAYDKYALKAFEVNAVDYILKPIERSRLSATIEKVKENVLKQTKLLNYKEVLEQITQKEESSIILSEVGQKKIIKHSDIIAFSANRSYTDIYLKEGEKVIASKNIGTYEQELIDESKFFRSHKSWIVNLREVLKVQMENETILMTNGLECKLSRFKKKSFHDALESLLKKN